MGIIIDIIIILIIAMSGFLGYKKGLTKSLLKIFTFIIALIISIILFKPISNIIINNTQIDETLQNSIVATFNNDKENEEDTQNTEDIEETKNKSEENNMPKIFNNYIEKQINNATTEFKQTIIEESAKQISITIINIGVIIIVYIISRIILIFIKGVANLITKIPVIKQCDEIGGLIFGILRAVIVIILLFTIISLFAPIIKNNEILNIINNSILGSYIYNNNILFSIIF